MGQYRPNIVFQSLVQHRNETLSNIGPTWIADICKRYRPDIGFEYLPNIGMKRSPDIGI